MPSRKTFLDQELMRDVFVGDADAVLTRIVERLERDIGAVTSA